MSLNCLFFMQSNPWHGQRKINAIGAILHETRVFEGTGISDEQIKAVMTEPRNSKAVSALLDWTRYL